MSPLPPSPPHGVAGSQCHMKDDDGADTEGIEDLGVAVMALEKLHEKCITFATITTTITITITTTITITSTLSHTHLECGPVKMKFVQKHLHGHHFRFLF